MPKIVGLHALPLAVTGGHGIGGLRPDRVAGTTLAAVRQWPEREAAD
jgi:hypothetical protein